MYFQESAAVTRQRYENVVASMLTYQMSFPNNLGFGFVKYSDSQQLSQKWCGHLDSTFSDTVCQIRSGLLQVARFDLTPRSTPAYEKDFHWQKGSDWPRQTSLAIPLCWGPATIVRAIMSKLDKKLAEKSLLENGRLGAISFADVQFSDSEVLGTNSTSLVLVH